MMKTIGVLVATSLAVACSSPSISPPQTPELEIGKSYYGAARPMLLREGWIPVDAQCSDTSICFGQEHPELASDFDTGQVCPRFVKDNHKIVVCLELISDGANVASVRTER